jgi:hypothetical protein
MTPSDGNQKKTESRKTTRHLLMIGTRGKRTLRGEQLPVGVELQPVGHTARRPENRGLAGLRVKLPDVPGFDGNVPLAGHVRDGDVAELDHPVWGDGHAFAQHEAAVEELFPTWLPAGPAAGV